MTIMLALLRSRSSIQPRATISALREAHLRKSFTTSLFDEIAGFDLATYHLSAATAYDELYELGIAAWSANASEFPQPCDRILSISAPASRQQAGLSVSCWEGVPRANCDVDFNLTVNSGIRPPQGYYCGISIFQASEGWDNPVARAALFRRALEAMGLADSVRIAFDDEGNMRMTATEPLVVQFPSAQIGGINPTSFNVCGLPHLDDALHRARGVLEHLPKKVLGIRFGAKFKPQGYEQVREQLNAVWRNGWTIDVLGSLSAEACRILGGGEPTADSPERIPAFTWWEGDFGPEVYGSILIQDGKCYLEVAIDNGDQELLRRRLSVLPGIEFDRVEP